MRSRLPGRSFLCSGGLGQVYEVIVLGGLMHEVRDQ